MSNTFNGVNLDVVAQRTLDTLMDELPLINSIATDFSAEAGDRGATVTTRYATEPTIQDFTATTSPINAATTQVQVTLSSYKGVRVGFTDLERYNSGVALDSIFARPVAHCIADALADDVMALVTNSNFSTAAFTGSASTFDADDVADLMAAVTAKKVGPDRFLALNPTYFAALLKDNSISAVMNYGGEEGVRGGKIPKLFGFNVLCVPTLPANSENLTGFAGGRQSLVVAARVPSVPANAPGEVAVATDPESGLSIQVRRWYSMDDRTWYMESGLVYGVVKGTAGLCRIVSA